MPTERPKINLEKFTDVASHKLWRTDLRKSLGTSPWANFDSYNAHVSNILDLEELHSSVLYEVLGSIHEFKAQCGDKNARYPIAKSKNDLCAFVGDYLAEGSVLEEDAYNIGKEVRQLVMDFYTLNYLWFWSGKGQESYGYQRTTIVPEALEQRIEGMFLEKTQKLGICLHNALERAIRRELRHAVPSDCMGKSGNMGIGKKDWEALTKTKLEDFDEATFPLEKAVLLFNSPSSLWERCYGGPLWGRAVEMHTKIATALKQTNPEKLVPLIDQLLDMQHNTGQLLGNTEFKVLSETLLDFRAQSRDIRDLGLWNSGEVRGLVKRMAHYLPCLQKPHQPTEPVVIITAKKSDTSRITTEFWKFKEQNQAASDFNSEHFQLDKEDINLCLSLDKFQALMEEFLFLGTDGLLLSKARQAAIAMGTFTVNRSVSSEEYSRFLTRLSEYKLKAEALANPKYIVASATLPRAGISNGNELRLGFHMQSDDIGTNITEWHVAYNQFKNKGRKLAGEPFGFTGEIVSNLFNTAHVEPTAQLLDDPRVLDNPYLILRDYHNFSQNCLFYTRYAIEQERISELWLMFQNQLASEANLSLPKTFAEYNQLVSMPAFKDINKCGMKFLRKYLKPSCPEIPIRDELYVDPTVRIEI